MTTTDVLRDARGDLDERTERVRRELRERANLTREQLAALSADLGDDLGERAAAARATILERYRALEQELPVEEITRRAQLGAWQALRAGLSGVLVLPGLVVRGLGALSTAADDLAVRGADVAERSRELVAVVPPSKAERRKRRRRTIGVALLGFLVGLVTGWLVADLDNTPVIYEPTGSTNGAPDPDPDPASDDDDEHGGDSDHQAADGD